MAFRPIGWFAEAPARRSYALAVLGVVGNVVSGTFVYEITSATGLAWARFHYTYSFYALCVLSFLVGRLTLSGSGIDKRRAEEINAFHYVRNSCLDAYAAQCRTLLQQGRLDEFHTAIDKLQPKS